MERLTATTTKRRQVADISDKVNRYLAAAAAGKTGICHLFLLHTTAALSTADLDPGTDLDYLDAFEVMVPKLRYRHPHDPSHVGDHILSTLIGTSLSLPFEDGKLILGVWQRVVLIEWNGPRECFIVASLIFT